MMDDRYYIGYSTPLDAPDSNRSLLFIFTYSFHSNATQGFIFYL